MSTTSIQQLKKALAISEKIEQLERELREVMGGIDGGNAPSASVPSPVRRGRPAKAQQVQEITASSAAAKSGKKTRRKRIVSPEARAKMAEAQRRRWAKAKR